MTLETMMRGKIIPIGIADPMGSHDNPESLKALHDKYNGYIAQGWPGIRAFRWIPSGGNPPCPLWPYFAISMNDEHTHTEFYNPLRLWVAEAIFDYHFARWKETQ